MNVEPTLRNHRIDVDISLLVVRIIVGLIFALHGSQKLFGAFGGKGLEDFVQLPPAGLGWLGYPVAIGEFFGGLGLMVGILTRFSAASLIVIMIGAIVKVHGQNGFFQQNNGFEYNLALIGLLVPILLCGPGRISIGRLFLPRSTRTGNPTIVIE
jgi:putative oxidoreductase